MSFSMYYVSPSLCNKYYQRNSPHLLLTAAIISFAGALAAGQESAAADAVRPVLKLHQTEATISITQGGTPVLVYNKSAPPLPDGIDPVYRRSGFLHPVATPGGRGVTATYPFDHPHQHGIFSAWVKASYADRDVDFWNLAGGTGRVLHERVVSTFADETAAGFEVDLLHRAEMAPAVDVLRERWKVTVHPGDGFHCFDLETTQQALTDLPLVIHKYHYGGMALRGPERWLLSNEGKSKEQPEREPGAFLNDQRSDRLQGNHEHAKWVAMSGPVAGDSVSIAVLCHKDNFRAPQAARLHPTKPYFCFSPCVDGQFTIARDHPHRARYRYLITDAPPDPEWLDGQWRQWCWGE